MELGIAPVIVAHVRSDRDMGRKWRLSIVFGAWW